MNQGDKKKAAARAALDYLKPGMVIGVGTGSTTNHFIDCLEAHRKSIAGAVASSEASAERLRRIGVELLDLNDLERLTLYVDGADEATAGRELVKGGGGALTREKIIAAASDCFICIIDDSKLVERLGAFPLPVEVIPMAVRHVARELEEMGGRPVLREGFVTDNCNAIIDVHGLALDEPVAWEERLNQITGAVTNGLFCRRPADKLIIADESGLKIL
jgi:ribose 5-phosphate isomerase A